MEKNNQSPLVGKTYGIGLRDKVGYALGDAAGLLTFALVGSFLQMFYTNVLVIDPDKVMRLFIAARLWDAVNDPIWGAVVAINAEAERTENSARICAGSPFRLRFSVF